MKIIFFDIDGTLISEGDHVLLDSTKEAVKKARENGHICMVNTGRTARLVSGWLPKLMEFDGYLCGCGTMITYHGEELLHQTYSVEQAKILLEGMEKYKIDALLEGKEDIYYKEPNKMYTKTFHDYVARFKHSYGSFADAPGRFDKFYCFADGQGAILEFAKEYSDLVDAIDREKGFFEIVPKGFSKASGMRFIADYLQQPMENTVAIGDSNNDAPMLLAAHTAIAMGNSTQAILDMADYVTTHVNEDGIYNALKWLGVL